MCLSSDFLRIFARTDTAKHPEATYIAPLYFRREAPACEYIYQYISYIYLYNIMDMLGYHMARMLWMPALLRELARIHMLCSAWVMSLVCDFKSGVRSLGFDTLFTLWF